MTHSTGSAGVCAWAAVLACAGTLGGCVTRAPLADHYSGPRDLPTELADRYAYTSTSLRPQSDPLKQRRSFVVREVSLPSLTGAADEPIAFEYYDLEGTSTTPVVVLLPILNGSLWISRYFARYFTERGWATLVVDREGETLREALRHPEQTIRRNLLEYRRILDWVAANPELDPDEIGIFGVSFGGMDAVMLAALDERVDAVVAAMAGGDLGTLLMNTSYRGIVRQIDRMLEETGLSRALMENRLNELIVTDPVVLAPYVNAEQVLLVMTRTDLIVPFEAQQALRASLGQPETLYLPTGHRTSVIYVPLLRSSAYDFFARRFDELR